MNAKEFVCTHYEMHRKFFVYTWVGIVITGMQIFLLYVAIDLMRIPTLVSSSVIIGGLFVFKYFVYRWTGFT